MKKFIYVLSAWLCFSFNVQAYTLTANVDTSRPSLGRTFYLTITADDNVSDTPDVSSLQKDFKVLSTSVSRKMTINNGRQSASTEWKIGLAPLNVGQTTIPSVTVGSQKTSPLSVDITAQAANTPAVSNQAQNKSNVSDYVIEGKILSPGDNFYVQEQILYNVTILDDGRLQSGTPAFEAENNDDWIIRSFGDPEVLTQTQSGKTKRLVIYKYALFPQKSGVLKIPAFQFTGTALGTPSAQAAFDPFGNDFFNTGFRFPSFMSLSEPVQLYVPAKEVNILPVPTDFRGSWWLPSQKVTLTAQWTDKNPLFKVGEAVTRELTLTSVGSTESQLPELKPSAVADVRQYPQKAVREERVVDGKLTASEKINVVYIPQKAGKIELPNVRILWYNTATKRVETAEIQPLTVDVLPADNSPVAKEKTIQNPATEVQSMSNPQEKEVNAPQKAITGGMVVWWIVGAFALGLFLGLVALRRIRTSTEPKPQCEVRRYPNFIIQKAKQGDFRSLRDALISWATGHFTEHRITNLKDIADAAKDPDFTKQIDLLMACLYQAQTSAVWNADDFIAAFRRISKKNRKSDSEKQPLPPLYG